MGLGKISSWQYYNTLRISSLKLCLLNFVNMIANFLLYFFKLELKFLVACIGASTLPLLSVNHQQQHHQQSAERLNALSARLPAIPPRPAGQQPMASAYAVSECCSDIPNGAPAADDGRGEGGESSDFVPQFLMKTASGNFFVPSGKLGICSC